MIQKQNMGAAFMVDLGAIMYFLNREDLKEVEEIKYEGWGKILSLYCPVEQLHAI